MVLTPNDTWHNHGTVGNEQALNLSVLDLPLVETLNAIHFDHDYKEEENGKLVSKKEQTPRFSADYSQITYGYGGLLPRFAGKKSRGAGHSSPMFVYRWEMVRELFSKHKDREGDPHDGLLIEYIDPTSGQPVFKTITFFAQMLQPGQKHAAGAARRRAFWSRRSRARVIRWLTANATIGTSSIRSPFRAAHGTST